MSDRRVIVLKFGGSVLPSEEALTIAAHEIYRWRREGYGVVAVVSAFDGDTDARFAAAIERGNNPCPHVTAAAVAQGELRSASQLGLFLERAGIPAAVLNPGALGLRATGEALDANPERINAGPFHRLLDQDRVVVCPGYAATDEDGRWVVLGRGGSDLSALFIADAIGAERCRLVKDVDGLYDADPKAAGPTPDRYDGASWDDALARDGSIIQHKALNFAKPRGRVFEMGRLNGVFPTTIGQGPLEAGSPESAPVASVAILGLGVVGQGVYEHLSGYEGVEVVKASVRDTGKKRDFAIDPGILTTDPVGAASSDADIVIELMGGTGIAGDAVEAALKRGAHVVTANKALIAERGAELHRLAEAAGGSLSYGASVGGSVPVIERIRARPGGRVRKIRAILNGTTNFILDRLAAGGSFEDSVAEAQRLGFAEADPTRDLVGLDASDKLRVLALVAGAPAIAEAEIARDVLEGAVAARAAGASTRGKALRHVGVLDLTGDAPKASVTLEELGASDPLYGIRGEHNAAIIEWESGETEAVTGRGAGRYPTAESVVGDVLCILRCIGRSNGEAARAGSCIAQGEVGV